MTRDWRAWHEAYDTEGPLRQRLAIVQRRISEALDRAPAGAIRVISMCAGQGRDLLGVLHDHPRARDVRARLVELDADLASEAHARAQAGVDIVCGDASTTSAYADAVPADLVLVCGVFGNIPDDDIARTIRMLPSLCASGASVIWTRHRRPPDRTIDIRRWLREAGFAELAFHGSEEFLFGVGTHQLARAPDSYQHGQRIFTFVGYEALR